MNKANRADLPKKVKDKIYLLYSMVMIAEGLCLDTKQMDAHDALCEMRLTVKGDDTLGELSDNIYEIYKSLGYSDEILLQHLLFIIARESKKIRDVLVNISPLSDFVDMEKARHIGNVALSHPLNLDIIEKIVQTNIFILNWQK